MYSMHQLWSGLQARRKKTWTCQSCIWGQEINFNLDCRCKRKQLWSGSRTRIKSTLIRVAGEEDNITGVFTSRVTFQQIDSLNMEKVISQICECEFFIHPTSNWPLVIQRVYIKHTAIKRQLTSARGLRKYDAPKPKPSSLQIALECSTDHSLVQ